MVTSMDRTVGPKADVLELEYIAALHQTSVEGTRRSGTISSLDIQRYLNSRHSLSISHKQAHDVIRGLGGGDAAMAALETRRAIAKRVAQKIRDEQAEKEREQKTHHLKWRRAASSSKGDSDINNSGNNQTKKKKDKEQLEQDKNVALVEEALHPKILYLDLVQTTSILLIPTLARIAQKYTKKDHANGQVDHSQQVASQRPRNEYSAVLWKEADGTEGVEIDVDAAAAAVATEEAAIATEEAAKKEGQVHYTSVPTNSKEDDEDDSPKENTTHNKDTMDGDKNDLDPQPDDLLEVVLHTMWNVIRSKQPIDSSNTTTSDIDNNLPPLLTTDMVQTLLLENGEVERANDAKLIQAMVDVVSTTTAEQRFDMAAFLTALTSDLQDWDAGCEDRTSTYVYDILGSGTLDSFEQLPSPSSSRSNSSHGSTKRGVEEAEKGASEKATNDDEEDNEDDNQEDNEEDNKETGPNNDARNNHTTQHPTAERAIATNSAKVIDTVVDAYGSTATMVLIWITYVCHSGTYASLVLATDPFTTECEDESFDCTLAKTVYTWLIVAVMLAGFGFCVLLPLAYGNHPTKRDPCRMFIATILAGVITFVPFFVVSSLRGKDDDLFDNVEELISSPMFGWVMYLTTSLGSALTLNYLVHGFVELGKRRNIIREEGAGGVCGRLYGITANIVTTAGTKRAATRKVNLMLTNARDMHGSTPGQQASGGNSDGILADSVRKEASDSVFQNYTLRGEKFVSAGSFIWSWQHILSGTLLEEEGIWLPSRLLIFQVGQVIIGAYVSYTFFYLVDVIAEAAEEARVDIDKRLTNYPDWVDDLVPTREEVRWALTPAAWIAVIVLVVLVLNYIPSTVTMILKFRCGQFSSLGAPSFQGFRAGADKAYMNTANAIYGMVAGAALFYFIIGLVFFLFVWEFSRDFVLLILAWGIGLTITIVLKMVMTSFCRKRFFRAFYRLYPGRANFTTLALECWFIGLGGGVLVGRVTQFLLAAAFWIGRIDEPFLAENVALLGYKFDYVPIYFTTDVLLHEAHRHPYIERLGTMYLMRLRHKGFGSDAGGCWRQLLVLTLMPWLMKYRVSHEQRCTESVQDQKTEHEVELDEDKEALASAARELLGTKGNVAGLVDKGAKAVGDVGLTFVDAGVNLIDIPDEKSAAIELLGTNGTVAGFVDKEAKAVGDVGLTFVDAGVNLVSTDDEKSAAIELLGTKGTVVGLVDGEAKFVDDIWV